MQSGVILEASSHESPEANPISEPVPESPLLDPKLLYSGPEGPSYIARLMESMLGRVQL